MYDWISLNGVRSDSMEGVVVMDWTPLRVPPRSRETVALPGRLSAIEQSAWRTEPAEITVTLAVIDQRGQAAVQEKWRTKVEPWLRDASRLTLSTDPDTHYRGAVIHADPAEDMDRWILVTVTFRANPPCGCRLLSRKAGWYPSAETPIPMQLTDETATAAVDLTAAGWIGEAYQGAESAELYLAVTGTWDSLSVGAAFQLKHKAKTETTVYIDAENAQVWRMDGSTEVNMMPASVGAMPSLRKGERLRIGGENIRVRARLLIIQRT